MADYGISDVPRTSMIEPVGSKNQQRKQDQGNKEKKKENVLLSRPDEIILSSSAPQIDKTVKDDKAEDHSRKGNHIDIRI